MRRSDTTTFSSLIPKRHLQNPFPAFPSSSPEHASAHSSSSAPISDNLGRPGFPMDPAVDHNRSSYDYSTKNRPRSGTTRRRDTQATFSTGRSFVDTRFVSQQKGRLQLHQRRRRSTENLSALPQVKHINQTISQSLVTPKHLSRSKLSVVPSNNRSEAAGSAMNISRPSITAVKGWEPEGLAGNPVAIPKATAAFLSNSEKIPDATKPVVLQSRLKVVDILASESNLASHPEDEDETRQHSPKRVKINTLQPLSSNVSPRSLMASPVDESAVTEAVHYHIDSPKNAQNTGKGPRIARSVAAENVPLVQPNTIDKPSILFNPHDPLATQAREAALSSPDSFWKWRAAKLNQAPPASTSAFPKTTLVPEVPPLSIVPEMLPVSDHEMSAPTVGKMPSLNVAQPPTPQREEPRASSASPSVSRPASLKAPTNQTQWTSPTQEQFGIPARSTSTAVNPDSNPAIPSADVYSTSPADSGGISELTRRLSSINLNTTVPAVIEDSSEEQSVREMVMLDGYPVSINTLRGKFRLTPQQFDDNFNADA